MATANRVQYGSIYCAWLLQRIQALWGGWGWRGCDRLFNAQNFLDFQDNQAVAVVEEVREIRQQDEVYQQIRDELLSRPGGFLKIGRHVEQFINEYVRNYGADSPLKVPRIVLDAIRVNEENKPTDE